MTEKAMTRQCFRLPNDMSMDELEHRTKLTRLLARRILAWLPTRRPQDCMTPHMHVVRARS